MGLMWVNVSLRCLSLMPTEWGAVPQLLNTGAVSLSGHIYVKKSKSFTNMYERSAVVEALCFIFMNPT